MACWMLATMACECHVSLSIIVIIAMVIITYGLATVAIRIAYSHSKRMILYFFHSVLRLFAFLLNWDIPNAASNPITLEEIVCLHSTANSSFTSKSIQIFTLIQMNNNNTQSIGAIVRTELKPRFSQFPLKR